MNHDHIPRILALILVIALVVICVILACPPAHAVECRLWQEQPKEPPWEPDPEDVALISRTIWGEVRGCCEAEQRAQAWCILNRVDDPRFPDSIAGVVLAKYQFQGFSWDNPVEPFAELAREILIMWHDGEREIPEDMVFCSGDGRHQRFRTDWIPNEETRYWP